MALPSPFCVESVLWLLLFPNDFAIYGQVPHSKQFPHHLRFKNLRAEPLPDHAEKLHSPSPRNITPQKPPLFSPQPCSASPKEG